MSDIELITRVEQLERELKALCPDLHFPSTATLEHRLRWLEIALEEMRARDNHGVYAETLDGVKLRKLLSHTVYIKPDRITLHGLTADPASVVAGDEWFRSDLGKAKLAIDAVVANAKLLRREGDTIPAAEIADLGAAKITSGRFGMARLPDGTSGYFLKAQGAGNDPIYAAMSLTVTEALAAAISMSYDLSWTTVRTVSIPTTAKKVAVWVAAVNFNMNGYARALYNGVERCVTLNAIATLRGVHWAGNGVGAAANLEIQGYTTSDAWGTTIASGAWYVTT